MAYWGVNLDSVSMITVIMCIGFAVDLSAHIAYAFSQAYGSAHHRAVEALETLGWPMFLVRLFVYLYHEFFRRHTNMANENMD